jgi:hypothetical protein
MLIISRSLRSQAKSECRDSIKRLDSRLEIVSETHKWLYDFISFIVQELISPDFYRNVCIHINVWAIW